MPRAADSAAVFAAPGEPHRLRIVRQLSDHGPTSVRRLTDSFGISRQAVSKHLRVGPGARAAAASAGTFGVRRPEGCLSRHPRGPSGSPTSAERVVGIDEAGRGSVLGPLVVAAFCCPEDRVESLRDTGVRDSKLLSPERRDRVYSQLGDIGELTSVALPPRTIDRYVRWGGLNELELETFAGLIARCAATVAYVDACDPNAERFGRRLETLVGNGTRVISRHKADRDFPIVSAASVVAKVRRDAAMDRLRTRAGESIGCGYAHDPETQACVERHARDGGRVPPWMRRSWETVQRVKRAHPARTLDAYSP